LQHLSADEVLQLHLEGHHSILDSEQHFYVVPFVLRWWEHHAGVDLAVDVGQLVEHLAAFRDGDLSLEIAINIFTHTRYRDNTGSGTCCSTSSLK
jgi:hypothetical protein